MLTKLAFESNGRCLADEIVYLISMENYSMIYPVRFNLKLFSWFQMATKLRRFSHRHNDDLVPLHIHGSLSLNALTTCKWLFWPYGTSSNFDHLQTLLDGLIHKDTIKSSADTFLNYSNPYIAPLQIHIEDNMNDRPHTNYIDPTRITLLHIFVDSQY